MQSIPSTQLENGQLGSEEQEPSPEQSVSHRQEPEQSTPLAQAADPLHTTSQRPGPQVTGPPQAPDWVQATSQAVAALQSTPLWQLEIPLHSTWQRSPAGQTTSSWHPPVPSHVMMQMSRWQRSQASGQLPASAGLASAARLASPPPIPPSPCPLTHQPSWQTRPSGHSVLAAQRKSSERAVMPQELDRSAISPSASH